MRRRIKLTKYAREIKVKGQFRGESDEVKTRLSPREFEKRREIFDEFQVGELGNHDYLEFVEWGGMGGRPRIYETEVDRKKAHYIMKKIEQGKPLKENEREFLRTINKGNLAEIG